MRSRAEKPAAGDAGGCAGIDGGWGAAGVGFGLGAAGGGCNACIHSGTLSC
ncbi:hypothetical protein [Dictyobacter kobayashii]|uniref:hypothetical protein n=1 Tax=Dictyobacter kobayashii TaxID=2014872 RepID=UPI00138660D2|nr:hypothetical protein [Dictyobacter kobayashii]